MIVKLTAAALGLSVALAGCGGDDEDPPALPPVTAPVSSSAPATSVSAFPETPEGAAAFARHFFDVLNQAYDENNPDLLRPLLGGASCQVCGRYLATLEELASGRASVARGATEVLDAQSPGEEDGLFTVVLQLRSGEVTFKDSAGRVVGREAPGERTSEMRLARDGSSWRVSEIVRVGSMS